MIRPAELTDLLTMIRASTAAMAQAIALLHSPVEKPISRRSLVAGAATLPAAPAAVALAGTAAAITPDPALAAVELARTAYKAIEDVLDGDAEAVCSTHSDAEWDMVQTIPTTRAGAVAMITAYLEQNAGMGEPEQMLLKSLAEAIPHLV
jgi:hypothetical protein